MAQYKVGPIVCWTTGSGAALFHAGTVPLPTDGVKYIRINAIEMRQDSGKAQVTFAFQITNDPTSWGSAIEKGAALAAEGVQYSATPYWYDVSSDVDTKRYFRAGVNCANDTDQTLAFCRVWIEFETKES